MPSKNVYIVDLGTGTNRNLLPLAAGLISSYSKSIPQIKDHFNIHIRFLRQDPHLMVAGFEDPALIAFSCYIWNFQATLHLARLTKERFPKAIVVLGGPSVPKRPERIKLFFDQYPFLDVLAKGEGEFTFADILLSQLEGRGLATVNGISFRCTEDKEGFVITPSRERIPDLNIVPSPFLDGTFDALMQQYGSHVTGTVWETDRGCPFSCTFCDWGGADVVKISKFPVERLYQELEWMSRNRIFYIYGADANFGIFYERDFAIAEKLADLCAKTGYPKFLMINWTKNSHEKIVAIADCLHQGGVQTNVTLAIQSFHQPTLKAIKRVNIKADSLLKLKEAFHDRNLSTYTELILGLPEETYSTFLAGINQAMTPRLDDHFVIYLCTILENTEMATPEYIQKYQIEIRTCQVAMTRRVFDKESPVEIEKIVVGTSTMPISEWRRAYRTGYFSAVLYNFRVAFFVMNYLYYQFDTTRTNWVEFMLNAVMTDPARYPTMKRAFVHIEKQIEMILQGISSVSKVEGLGEIVLSPYEALLYILLEDKENLYEELKEITLRFCNHHQYEIPENIFNDIFLYQKIRMPVWPLPQDRFYDFKTNIPEYFQAMIAGDSLPMIVQRPTGIELVISTEDFENKLDSFFARVRSGHTINIYNVKICNKGEAIVPDKYSPINA